MPELDPELEAQCMEALAAARAYVKKKAPYIADTLYSLVPKLIPGFKNIMTTNRHVLCLDPEFFLELGTQPVHANADKVTDEQRPDAIRAAVLMHEMSHLLRDMERLSALNSGKNGFNPLATKEARDINTAFDIPINDDLSDAGWLLPAFGVFANTYGFPKNLTGEQYYELLKQLPPPPPGTKECDGNGNGEGNKVTAGGCGSCAGNPGDEQEATTTETANREIGRSAAECDRIVRETAKAIKDHAETGRGDVPHSLLSNLPPDQKRSVIPWKYKLATITRRVVGRVVSGQRDFSMRRLSKRSFTRGIMRPGMISREPIVLFIEDSSGSMGTEQLLSSRREQAGILRQCGISRAWFMDADAAVSCPPRQISVKDLATLPVHGGGGTNFAPALEAATKLKPRPDICFYLTDGDGYAPELPPKGMEVVWVIVPSPWGRAPAKWGHLVVVSDDAEIREPYENDNDD